MTASQPTNLSRLYPIYCGSRPAGDGVLTDDLLFANRVHIHSCGNGRLWFRSYSESLGKTERRPAPSNQGLLPLAFGASLMLGMPSLRSCSVGPLRRTSTRPLDGARKSKARSKAKAKAKARRANARPRCWVGTRSPVGAGLSGRRIAAMAPERTVQYSKPTQVSGFHRCDQSSSLLITSRSRSKARCSAGESRSRE